MIVHSSRPHSTHDVLVVDPDDDVRGGLILYLRLHGARAVGTRAEGDTLQRLREGFRPCLVFVDPRRVGLDAWALVDYIRRDSVLTNVPLVLVVGERLLEKSARWRGVAECISKPATPPRFVAALEHQCRHWGHRLASPHLAPKGDRPAVHRPRHRRSEAADLRRLA